VKFLHASVPEDCCGGTDRLWPTGDGRKRLTWNRDPWMLPGIQQEQREEVQLGVVYHRQVASCMMVSWSSFVLLECACQKHNQNGGLEEVPEQL
jgi:hypothetical protein